METTYAVSILMSNRINFLHKFVGFSGLWLMVDLAKTKTNHFQSEQTMGFFEKLIFNEKTRGHILAVSPQNYSKAERFRAENLAPLDSFHSDATDKNYSESDKRA